MNTWALIPSDLGFPRTAQDPSIRVYFQQEKCALAMENVPFIFSGLTVTVEDWAKDASLDHCSARTCGQ